jgi:FkbM family methyltransferase
MNLRDLRYARFNSSLARALLRFYYRPGGAYKIWFGPLSGWKLRYDPSVNFHAILGLWDAEIFALLKEVLLKSRLLPLDGVVADVGGNIGYYTMWLSRVAVPSGKVYTFEPNPEAIRLLRDNLHLNHVSNVEIVTAACGDHVGMTDFFLAEHHQRSSLHEEWAKRVEFTAKKIRVPVTTLDAFFGSGAHRKALRFVKFDIEGGGTFALQGCKEIIFVEDRPLVLIESHTPKEDCAIADILCRFNYRGFRLDDLKWVKRPDVTYPHREGVWGTLLLVANEHYGEISDIVRWFTSRRFALPERDICGDCRSQHPTTKHDM